MKMSSPLPVARMHTNVQYTAARSTLLFLVVLTQCADVALCDVTLTDLLCTSTSAASETRLVAEDGNRSIAFMDPLGRHTRVVITLTLSLMKPRVQGHGDKHVRWALCMQ